MHILVCNEYIRLVDQRTAVTVSAHCDEGTFLCKLHFENDVVHNTSMHVFELLHCSTAAMGDGEREGEQQ